MRLKLTIGLFFALSAALVPSFGAQAAPRLAQGGDREIRVSVSASGGIAPSFESDRPLLLAPSWDWAASLSFRSRDWIVVRAGLGNFWTGDSAYDSYLFSYRGFQGATLSLETGYRLPLGGLKLELLAGAALSVSKYTATSLVTAFPSAVADIRLILPWAFTLFGAEDGRLELGVPLAFEWRASAATIEAGLSLGASIPLGKRSSK